MNPEELITLKVYPYPFEAEAVKEILDDEGIECHLFEVYKNTSTPFMCSVKETGVAVRAGDFKRASQIIEEDFIINDPNFY